MGVIIANEIFPEAVEFFKGTALQNFSDDDENEEDEEGDEGEEEIGLKKPKPKKQRTQVAPTADRHRRCPLSAPSSFQRPCPPFYTIIDPTASLPQEPDYSDGHHLCCCKPWGYTDNTSYRLYSLIIISPSSSSLKGSPVLGR